MPPSAPRRAAPDPPPDRRTDWAGSRTRERTHRSGRRRAVRGRAAHESSFGRTLLSGHDTRLHACARRHPGAPSSTTCATRLGPTRFPNQVDGVGWEMGTELRIPRDAARVLEATRFDWRAQEARFNAFEPTATRKSTASASTSCTRVRRNRTRCRSSSRTAGPVRSSSSSTCSARSRTRARTAAIRPTPSTWSRRRSRVTASPVPRTSGVAPTAHGRGVHPDHGGPRLRPLRRAGRRLGFDRVAERRRPRPRARVRPAPQLHHRAATEGRAGPDTGGAARPRGGRSRSARPAPATRRSRARSRRRSATRSKTRRRVCARGSSRSSPRGPTATATSNASSRKTSCSPTSPSTG